MRPRRADCVLVVASALLLASTSAHAGLPAAARERVKLGYQLAHDRAHLVLDRGAFVSPPYIRALTITDALGAATTFEDGTSHVLTPAGATELRLGTFNTFGNETLQVVFDHVFVRRYQ